MNSYLLNGFVFFKPTFVRSKGDYCIAFAEIALFLFFLSFSGAEELMDGDAVDRIMVKCCCMRSTFIRRNLQVECCRRRRMPLILVVEKVVWEMLSRRRCCRHRHYC